MEGEPRAHAKPAIDLGPQCPNCGEPWLRPTNLPGRYRCVYCLHRFELDLGVSQLRRALDDRTHVLDRDREVQQLRRVDAAVDMSGRQASCCAGSRRAVDPVRRLRAPARAGRRRARRRRAGDPRRRDGRPLRPADHVGPLVVDALARADPRGRRDARRAPDDRAPRAPRRRVRRRRRGLDHVPRRGHAAPRTTRLPDPRERRQLPAVAINPSTPLGCWRRSRTRSTWRCA